MAEVSLAEAVVAVAEAVVAAVDAGRKQASRMTTTLKFLTKERILSRIKIIG